jgi:DNA mismatch repair protein MutH
MLNYWYELLKGVSSMINKNEEELKFIARQAEGKTLGEIDISGQIGQIIEEDFINLATPSDFKVKSLEQFLKDKLAPYAGKSLEEISLKTGNFINQKSKSFLPEFISELLGIKGANLNKIEEFAKANIKIKTIRLEPDGVPKEHMSFKNVNFLEWAQEDWNDSWLKNHFEETKFLFIVFHYNESIKDNPNRPLYFSGVKVWNMPMPEIEGRLKNFWLNVNTLIHEGIELVPVQQKNKVIVQNNLPNPGINGLCHIRPKAINGDDKTLLPDGRRITKQAFWLDKEAIGEICKSIQ